MSSMAMLVNDEKLKYSIALMSATWLVSIFPIILLSEGSLIFGYYLVFQLMLLL